MKRNFNGLMLSLKKSITPADFFVDFSKVYLNIKDYERHLNLLNSLIGKENIEEEFVDLINEYPKIMKSIPILLATHEYKFHIINSSTVDMLSSIKDKDFKFLEEKFYAVFLKNSGLFDLISNRKIKNLVDYAIGIEVGLDSNSRKNRSGKIMEDLVEEFIKKLGIPYQKQMKYKDIDKANWNAIS